VTAVPPGFSSLQSHRRQFSVHLADGHWEAAAHDHTVADHGPVYSSKGSYPRPHVNQGTRNQVVGACALADSGIEAADEAVHAVARLNHSQAILAAAKQTGSPIPMTMHMAYQQALVCCHWLLHHYVSYVGHGIFSS